MKGAVIMKKLLLAGSDFVACLPAQAGKYSDSATKRRCFLHLRCVSHPAKEEGIGLGDAVAAFRWMPRIADGVDQQVSQHRHGIARKPISNGGLTPCRGGPRRPAFS